MKNNKRIYFYLFCFGLLAVLTFSFASKAFCQDKIIAVVNSEIITQKDLNDFANFLRMEYQGKYKGEELEKKIRDMRQDLLEKLIEDRLILQEAKRSHIIVDSAKVKAKIDELKSHYPTNAQFQQALMQQGLVQGDVEAKIKDQVMMYNVIEFKVKNGITVQPSEVTEFYNKHTSEFKSQEGRQVQAIKVAGEDKAKLLCRELGDGKLPESVAGKYSFELENIEVTQNKEYREEIESAVFKLKPGELSSPVKVDDYYYIFKLEKIIPPRPLALSEVQENIHNYLFGTKMQDALVKWIDSLRKRSYIKIL